MFFIIQCGRELGFGLKGSYTPETRYVDLQEGCFSEKASIANPLLHEEEASALDRLISVSDYEALKDISLSAATRLRLLDWYIAFLQLHSEHMGNIKSLAVLRVILH